MTPRISVGIPVFNGMPFLVEAVESILAQTFSDFELIISDNASNDQTEDICRKFAVMDRRIHYHRLPENLGATRNFNRLFAVSHGDYFKWAASDDVLAPDYLRRCVEVLDNDPSVVLCHSRAYKLRDGASIAGPYDFPMRTHSPLAHVRFGDVISTPHLCMIVFGVIRRSALSRTRLIGNFVGSDWNLLAELALIGKLYELPDYLFFRRSHARNSFRQYARHDRMAWYDPSRAGMLHLPAWRQHAEYLVSLHRLGVPWPLRIRCGLRWARCVCSPRIRSELVRDLKVAVKHALRRELPWRQSGKEAQGAAPGGNPTL